MWSPLAFNRPEYELARKHGPVFPYQFILSPKPIRHNEDFEEAKFSNFTLYHGKRLECHVLEIGAIEVMFLGVAVDRDGYVVTADRLKDILKQYKTLNDIAMYLVMCAGRYIFALSDGREQRLYLDPAGMYSAAYNPSEQVIASTATLAVSSPLQENISYPLWESAAYPRGARFAFEQTLDKRAKQLSPNFYLDMVNWTTHRHWPHEDQDFLCQSLEHVERCIEITHTRHAQIIGALAAQYKVAMPVTGGQDSRLLLAFSKEHLSKIDLFYSHVTNYNTKRDAEIGAELCAHLEVPHKVFQVLGNIGNCMPKLPLVDLRRRYLIRQGNLIDDQDLQLTPLLKRELCAFNAVPKGHLVLRGHITDISKAVLWRQIGLSWFQKHRKMPVEARRGVQLMQLRPSSDWVLPEDYFFPSFDAWANEIPQNVKGRSVDLMGLEQYRSYGLGFSFHGYENNFYMAPGNDRQIIAALASPPPNMRAQLHVNDLLLKRAVPAFVKIKYVRDNDNKLRDTRKAIEEYL